MYTLTSKLFIDVPAFFWLSCQYFFLLLKLCFGWKINWALIAYLHVFRYYWARFIDKEHLNYSDGFLILVHGP